jgi:RimJ/RimL family protein N-acetyltransferase
VNLPEFLPTERLVLRRWRDADRAPFMAMNSDPTVMEYMPSVLSHGESDAMVDRIRLHFERHGFGLWVVELSGEAPFVGYVGLSAPGFDAHFTPAVEISWRLDVRFWRRGIVTEAARACVAFAFDDLGLAELVSFTVPGNVRSRRVMERLGFTTRAADDFDHPLLPEGHPLRRHVLYRLARPR